MKGVLLVSHGSRSSKAKFEVDRLAEAVRKKSGAQVFYHAFLEIADPDVSQGIELCVKKGAREIVVLQHFLNSGDHVLRDIPYLLEKARRRYRGISFRVMPVIGTHPQIADLYVDLIGKAGGGRGGRDSGMREHPARQNQRARGEHRSDSRRNRGHSRRRPRFRRSRGQRNDKPKPQTSGPVSAPPPMPDA